MDLHQFLFWTIGLITCLCAVAVVVTQNIVRAATWLLFTLAGTAGLFFLLGADLIGAIQILVYVGGTLILVVFGVMLTAQGPFVTMKASAAEWAISAIVGMLFLSVLVVSILSLNQSDVGPPKEVVVKSTSGQLPNKTIEVELHKYAPKRRQLKQHSDNPREQTAESKYTATIGQGLLGVPVGPAHKDGDRKNPDGTQRVIRTTYLLPFEIVSVHLLVVLIGAAYLARAKRRRTQS